jgi:hypothetical protein
VSCSLSVSPRLPCFTSPTGRVMSRARSGLECKDLVRNHQALMGNCGSSKTERKFLGERLCMGFCLVIDREEMSGLIVTKPSQLT